MRRLTLHILSRNLHIQLREAPGRLRKRACPPRLRGLQEAEGAGADPVRRLAHGPLHARGKRDTDGKRGLHLDCENPDVARHRKTQRPAQIEGLNDADEMGGGDPAPLEGLCV